MVSSSISTGLRSLSLALVLVMTNAQSTQPLVNEGCYTSSGSLVYANTNPYQTTTLCQQTCIGLGKPVLATTKGSDCYCGDTLPATSYKTSDSSCSTKCNGWPEFICGGPSAFTVQLSGTSSSVSTDSGSGSGSNSNSGGSSSVAASSSAAPSSSSVASSSSAAPSTTQNVQPSVVTHASTIIVTAPGATQPTTTVISTTEPAPKKSSANVAGIAAGVVVGIVAVAAAIGILFFVLRNRKRRQIEAAHRNSLGTGSSWWGQRPSSGSNNSMTDSRLEPSVMMQRRHSDVSIADNQDYSRRILKVTNPDGS